jgi:hypothetical protein
MFEQIGIVDELLVHVRGIMGTKQGLKAILSTNRGSGRRSLGLDWYRLERCVMLLKPNDQKQKEPLVDILRDT